MAPDLLNLFVEPSVALLYFMSVIVLSYAALFMALGQRMRGPVEREAGRYALASLGVAVAWMILMVGAMAVLITSRPAATIMPPLDRAVGALVVLLIGWAFLTANPQPQPQPVKPTTAPWLEAPAPRRYRGRWITAITALLFLVTIGGYVYTATQWFNTTGVEFNPSLYGQVWTGATTALAALWLLLIILRFRITVDAPLKLIFFVLVLGGYGYTLYGILTGSLRGDEAGAIRLAFLAGIPFLPIVVYRVVVDRLTGAVERAAQQQQAAIPTQITTSMPIETSAERESMTLLRTLGMMIEREQPEDLPQMIAEAATNTLKADVAAILALDDAEYADVLAAFDNVQRKPIAAMALKRDEQPVLQAAIDQKSQQMLSTDRNLNELVDLYTRLDIQKVGPAYFQPLNREGETIGVLVIALPYTQRDLRENERKLLESMAPIAARLLSISRAAQKARLESQDRAVQAIVEGAQPIDLTAGPAASPARAEVEASLDLARNQIRELNTLVRDLQIELDYERSRIAELVGAEDSDGTSITQRIEKMAAERVQLTVEREKLVEALQEAQTQLATASGDDQEVYRTMVGVLEQERAELQTQKTRLEQDLAELRAKGQTQTESPGLVREMLTRLSDERAHLTVERDQVKQQLSEVEGELAELGIEGGAKGLSSVIVQLTDERTQYKVMAERAVQERDTLLAERQRITGQIANEQQRDAKITALETELRRLAEDREALGKQRDGLRQERDTHVTDREKWEMLRTKMVADMASVQVELEEALFERNRSVAERNQMAAERTNLLTERDRLLAERTALQTERDQLLARLEGNRDTLQQLGEDGVGALKKMIDDLTEERSDLEHQLLRAKGDLRALEAEFNKITVKLSESKLSAPIPLPLTEESAEVMLSIAQELRTPMSGITAYIDLLLGDSVGALSPLQRQFMQRVKANSDRLHTLVEDFVRITAIDTGQLKLKAEKVDMVEVIDDAITATRTQFREKGITLKLDVPDELPEMTGDRSALQQIVTELLSNAYLASPTDGEVTIAARLEKNYKLAPGSGGAEETADVIALLVRDMGGGVPPEEQARVFTRLYRADNPLIQGLGDTGVGLSIARALTEAHGGRIWLESTPGVSSTVRFVIPLQGILHSENLEHAAS